MIPKIIHYIWVGSDLPERVKSLINHNKTFSSDYKVEIWTDERLPKLNTFADRALIEKNWAFVSDYVRFIVLRNHGGIYLDTDQKLLKNIDDLLDLKFFAGWNKEKKFIYTGIIGSVPRSDFVSRVLEEYDNLDFNVSQTSPKVVTRCYKKYDSKIGLKIFDFSYFYPVQAGEKDDGKIFNHSYSTHLWDESWVKFSLLRRFLRHLGVIKVFHFFRKYFDV